MESRTFAWQATRSFWKAHKSAHIFSLKGIFLPSRQLPAPSVRVLPLELPPSRSIFLNINSSGILYATAVSLSPVCHPGKWCCMKVFISCQASLKGNCCGRAFTSRLTRNDSRLLATGRRLSGMNICGGGLSGCLFAASFSMAD